jgi:hypothetical protein
VEEVIWHVWGKAPEVPQKLWWLAVAHLFKRKELADASLSLQGQPPHLLGPQHGVGVLLRQRDDDILYFCSVLVVQLWDHMAELCLFTADAGQGKLCLGLGEPQGWPLSPEQWKPRGHSGYLRWYWAVHSLHSSSSGSPVWGVKSGSTERQTHKLLRFKFYSLEWYWHRIPLPFHM